MSNVEICQVAYEGRMTRLKMMLESNPKLISVADQVRRDTARLREKERDKRGRESERDLVAMSECCIIKS